LEDPPHSLGKESLHIQRLLGGQHNVKLAMLLLLLLLMVAVVTIMTMMPTMKLQAQPSP
jgi:hypothetical protein